MKTYVLFHGNCQDGYGAAWSARDKLGDNAIYIPCFYGAPTPEVDAGSQVYMIDYSDTRENMLKLYDHCNGNLVVIDHHKSAKENLEGLDFAHFDMTKSGALLAWEYFHPDEVVPLIIRYISDRDLWKYELPDTKAFSVALFSYPYDFKVWDKLAYRTSNLIEEGQALLRYQETLVKMICEKSEIKEIDGYKVAMVNSTSHWSEVGAFLLTKYPECDYSASYFIEGNQKKWSLRSRENFDVSVIAKNKAGGGHKQAAGYVEQLKG